MLKKLALLIALIYSNVLAQNAGTETGTLVPGTIYSTGNIVQPTVAGTNQTPWVNGVYQDQLTCWGWGNPGNCGPNPTVRPGNYINYSFGYTDLYQIQSIASILPSTGLRVNGYNFGFTAKNGNGWDDGRLDQLNAYVAFYGTDGKIKDYTNYNLNSQFNWTTFNYSKDFVTPYADKDLSTVQYGFTGKDNNFWAGTYGPEIMNVSFSLKYSADPCATNVLSSPTCPGYLDALAKLAPAPTTTTVTEPITTTTTSAGTTTTVVTDPVASTVNVTSTTSTAQPSVVASVVSAPAPITSSTSTATSTTTSSSTASSSSSQSSKETTSSGGGNVSLALSVISKNQERDAAGSAVAQAAVSQAQAAATQAQQEAQSVAASAVANSMTANIVTVGGQQSTGTGIKVNNNNNNNTNFTLQSGQTNIASLSVGPQTNTNNTSTQQSSNNTGLSLINNQPVVVASVAPQQSSLAVTEISYVLPLLQPTTQATNIATPIVFAPVEQQQTQQTTLQSSSITSQSIENYSIVPPNFLTDKTNPLTDIIEGKGVVPENNTASLTGPSVNKNAGNNDVAGGVDINKIALAPVGYGNYLSLTLKDAAFYAPKEVYKNQRNVDNARAFRSLASDRVHQEMVEQQYKGK